MANGMTAEMDRPRADALDDPRLYSGVLSRRVLAFLVDYTLVLLLSIPVAIVIFFLGLLSFGLAWGLYAVLLPVLAVGYVAFTMGSSTQATPGMQLAGVRVARLDGGSVEPILAVLHGVLFWASVAVLTPLVLLIALFTGRKQLLHDLLLGTVIVRDR